jgi:uncharacterized phage-associated protein
MSFVFDLRKAAQEASVLLKKATDNTMPYMKLIKLLYLADRESLRRYGFPISGDKPVAMPHGAALSAICDFASGKAKDDVWSGFIATERYDAKLVADAGVELLSPADIEILEDVFEQFGDCDQWELSCLTHDLHEYKKNDPGKSSRPIPLADIVEGIERTSDLAEFEQNQAEDRYFASLFGR